jgi:hypothetical protein
MTGVKMIKKFTVLFCLILLAIPFVGNVIANDNQTGNPAVIQTPTIKDAGGKLTLTTDLGKGLPYRGLTSAELEKLNSLQRLDSLKNQQNEKKPQISQTKPADGSNLNSAVSNEKLTISPKVKSAISTDIGRGLPYPGLSAQEQEKLKNTGGK